RRGAPPAAPLDRLAGVGVHVVRHAARLVRQRPAPLLRGAPRPLPPLRGADPLALPGRRGVDRAPRRRRRARVRVELAIRDRLGVPRRPRDGLRDRPRAADHPEPRRRACLGRPAGGADGAPSVGRMGDRRRRGRALLPARRAGLSRRHGHGRRQARLPARRRAGAERHRGAPLRDDLRARPVGLPARPARAAGAQDGDPVRAVPGPRRRPRPLCRAPDPALVSEGALMEPSKMDKQRDLRLIGGEASEDGQDAAFDADSLSGDGTNPGELVAEMIKEAGLLDADKVDQVRQRIAAGSTFSQGLVEEGYASALGVARKLAEEYHLPLVDLAVAGVDAMATKAIPLPVLERVCAIPFASDGTTIKVAITNPQDVRGLDEIKLATRLNVVFYVAARNDVLTELRRLGRAAEAMNATFLENIVVGDEEERDQDDLEADDGISDAPLVRLVNSMIFQAAEDGASDIHVEPQENELIVRYRIDGVLHIAHRIPKRLAAGVTTRLKVLAKLDIAERRKPQDGRITLGAAAAGRMLDIRVATLPTVEGESVTMRLLDKSRDVPT